MSLCIKSRNIVVKEKIMRKGEGEKETGVGVIHIICRIYPWSDGTLATTNTLWSDLRFETAMMYAWYRAIFSINLEAFATGGI